MITAKTTDPKPSQDEMAEKGITSVFDNFETVERIMYQGDEPILRTN